MTKNYKHRPKYKKLLEHPFIKKYEALPIDVSVWYQTVIRQIESNQLVRQSPQRTSQRMYTPPSPSLRRVTSEPPPIPPRTPESQRKPLLVRLASEPVVDGLDFQTINGRVTVVGTKPTLQQQPFQFDPKPPPGKPSPPVAGPIGPGGFRFNLPLRPPALPPRPPPTGGTQQPQPQSTQQASPSEETLPSLTRGLNPSRVTSPPTDLPGLPPRPPPAGAESAADRNSSSVARLAQMFGTQLSPAR